MKQFRLIQAPSAMVLVTAGLLWFAAAVSSVPAIKACQMPDDVAQIEPLVETLVACLADEDAQIATAAADALVAIGTDSVDPVIAAMNNESSGAKPLAADVLGRIGSRRALPALGRLLREDETKETRLAALRAIKAVFLCEASAGEAKSPVAKPHGDISGQWASNWGPVKIRCGPCDENRTYPLTGSWVQGPQMFGEIVSGTFDSKTGVFRFRFDEPWHNQTGSAQLQRSDDGNTLSGTWQFDRGGGGSWTMKRP